MDTISPSSNQGGKPATAFSCVRCFERKVKCDKLQPCSACTKHGAECIYRVPAPPRRRKKRVQEDLLTERLRRYEQVLQQQGIEPSDIMSKSSLKSPAGDQRAGQDSTGNSDDYDRKYASSQLFYNSGRSHYVENNLWNRVKEEIGTTHEAFDVSSDSDDDADTPYDESTDFMLPWSPSSITRPYHPHPDHVLSLWKVFLENVNPLSKVIHRPTLEVMILKAIQNLDKVPRGLEALMFSIYSAAVTSLTGLECQDQFGEAKKLLESRYRAATKAALSRARFLGTSDLVVLQALALHLLIARTEYDSRTLWVLTGAACRIGEGMGLHRDPSDLGLPVFESEMRRRLYWQIVMMDYRAAELSGSARYAAKFYKDFVVQLPLNIDDDEIYPGMTHAPLPSAKASEMVFCSLRYGFAKFWSKKQEERERKGAQHDHLWANYDTIDGIANKDKDIDELQHSLQTALVGYCDPMDPVQLMTSLVATVAIASMRLVAHHPRRYSHEEDIPESERQLLWAICCKLLEGDIMAYTDHKLQRFVWHTSFYFQFQAIIHVLDCLRAQPLMAEANKAWQLIEAIYENRPEFVENTNKPIHIAVGTLCLKAYNARDEARAKTGLPTPLNPPRYIVKLRQQREAAHAKQADAIAAKLRSQEIGGSEASTYISTPSPGQPEALSGHQRNRMPLNSAWTNATNDFPFTAMANLAQPPAKQSHVAMNTASAMEVMSQPSDPWFDNFGYQDPMQAAFDVDLMLSQSGNSLDANANMVDWTQWDNLIQNYDQTIGR